ncbi:MAG: hypothetical protein AAF909_15015, partial [Pseudomonadota bacterium]
MAEDGSSEEFGAPMAARILFACTYNATRSPMAQAICEKLSLEGALPPVEALSAGVYTGSPVDPMAAQVMR